ncbi:hypothetical protein ACHAW5_004062 [Stephanodiscus triporus]|uniref:L domain-like protein n=1 Tax=Stephanodiscus triporus TaxID=2934178 RepID=A0ABD3QG05_9STRA
MGVKSATLVAGCLLAAAAASTDDAKKKYYSRFLRKRQNGTVKYGYGTGEQHKALKKELDITAEDVVFWTRSLQSSYPPLPTTAIPIPPTPMTPAPVEPTPMSPAPITPAPIDSTPIPITPAPITPAPTSPAPTSLAPITSTPAPMTPPPVLITPLPSSLFPTFPPTPIPSTMNPTLSPSASPTQPCNLSPDARTAQIRELMSTISDPVLFDDPTTPQARALEWITNEDTIVPTLCPNNDGLGCTNDGVNPMVQRYVLATFYFATNGDDWNQCSAPENFDDAASVATANDNCNRVVTPFGVANERVVGTDAWLGPVNECYWGGVACWGADTPNLDLCLDQLDFANALFSISDIEKENNGLSGKLVPELSVLPSMRFLILEQGTISGPIPSEYGKLERLLIIDMDFNEISGTLPETLYDLSAMQQLDLNDNQLTGTISTRIGELSALTFFQIDHNSFSSTIPSEMGQLSSLRIAFLSVNGFTGAMPEDVCALRNNTSPPGLLGVLVTDCLGNPPEVDCPCCSSCA